MGYYDFPHTRNYDTDLGYLINWFITNKNKIDENTAITIEKALSASENAIKAYNSATSASNSATNASNSAELALELKNQTEALKNLMQDKINQIDANTSRIDNLATINQGSITTTADAELVDIRVGYNGTTYPSAGDSVRGQISEIKSDLDSLVKIINIPDVIRNSTVGNTYKNDGNFNKIGPFVFTTSEGAHGFTIDTGLSLTHKYRLVIKPVDGERYVAISAVHYDSSSGRFTYQKDYYEGVLKTTKILDMVIEYDGAMPYIYTLTTIKQENNKEFEIALYDITGISNSNLNSIDFSTFSENYKTDDGGYVIDLINGDINGDEWNGKRFTSYGDSTVEQERWQPYLNQKYKFIHTNCGKGGTTITTKNNGMCTDERVNSIPLTTELLIVLGGINDWLLNTPMGDLSMNNTDTNTFIGALNVMFTKLINRLPKARIIALGTTCAKIIDLTNTEWIDNEHNKESLTTKDYNDAIGKVSSWYGIKFADVFANGGWSWLNIDSYVENDGAYIHFDEEHGGKRVAECAIGCINEVSPINGIVY